MTTAELAGARILIGCSLMALAYEDLSTADDAESVASRLDALVLARVPRPLLRLGRRFAALLLAAFGLWVACSPLVSAL